MIVRSTKALALAMLVAGCTATVQYVVLSDVPPEPSITVIPSSGAREDAVAADMVTGWTVGAGVRTLARPVMLKTQADYSGSSAAGGVAAVGGQLGVALGNSNSQGGMTTSVDAMSLLDSTQADYVIYVRAKGAGPYATLVKRASKQVLFAGVLQPYTDGDGVNRSAADQLCAMLNGAGIKARVPERKEPPGRTGYRGQGR
jgi:hypothetical protein